MRWLLVAKTGRLSSMPMYHVHVAKKGKTFDPKPVELPDIKSAKSHAERVAEGLTALCTGFGVGSLRDCRVEVADTKGRTVARYELSKAQPRNANSRSA
jgi:Domain of unknown function (DUF6894)